MTQAVAASEVNDLRCKTLIEEYSLPLKQHKHAEDGAQRSNGECKQQIESFQDFFSMWTKDIRFRVSTSA